MTGPPLVSAIVVGGSAGGMEALCAMLVSLPADFPIPILVVNHLHASDGGRFAAHLTRALHLPVSEARDKQPIEPPHVLTAPADYHLQVEGDKTLSLSADPRVNWTRPSIDILFESAAREWADALVCVVLSGANDDGAQGARIVKSLGGLAVAQDPSTARFPVMPQAAINLAEIDHVLPPADIGSLLLDFAPSAAPPRGFPGVNKRKVP